MDTGGIITLLSLHQIALADVTAMALQGNSLHGKAFGKEIRRLCAPIPKERGFYAWGRFDDKGLWKTIYVGKAGSGKASTLNARITEELFDERVFFWSEVHCDPLSEALKHHIERANSLEGHFKRAMLKAGTTHIVWVATPHITNDEVKLVEPDLIETLNPTVNIQRAAPKSGLQDVTVAVIRDMKKHIHEIRPGKRSGV